MPSGIYDNDKRRKANCLLKERIICKRCFNVFYPDTSIKRTKRECPDCGNIIDIRDKSELYKKYCIKHPENIKDRFRRMKQYDKDFKKERGRKTREMVKRVIFNIISNKNPACSQCGCSDIRLLEINHKDGGGSREIRKMGANSFYREIYKGKRKTSDLELLCRVCNAKHYLELKYGKLPFIVRWENNQ